MTRGDADQMLEAVADWAKAAGFVGMSEQINEARIVLAPQADTHPKDGDVKQAPLVSGGGPEGMRQNTDGSDVS